jgi:hypothetical protein
VYRSEIKLLEKNLLYFDHGGENKLRFAGNPRLMAGFTLGKSTNLALKDAINLNGSSYRIIENCGSNFILPFRKNDSHYNKLILVSRGIALFCKLDNTGI